MGLDADEPQPFAHITLYRGGRKVSILRNRNRGVFALAVGGMAVAFGAAATARAATVNLNFNGSDQFTPNFTIAIGGGSNVFSYSSTAGIQDQPGPANGGGVLATATAGSDVTALYNGQ